MMPIVKKSGRTVFGVRIGLCCIHLRRQRVTGTFAAFRDGIKGGEH